RQGVSGGLRRRGGVDPPRKPPADDLAAVGIQERHQVGETARQADGGDVRHPDLVERPDLLCATHRGGRHRRVSGISGDMRTLLASEDPRARRAIDLYPYRIRRELGSLTAALGKVDALVFTAGT